MSILKTLILRVKDSRHWKPITLLVFLAMFLFTRIIYLDEDIPMFKLLYISGADELYWNISAFNLYKYGSWAHKVFDFLPPDELPFTSMQNFMTFLGLELFGNNYYGLRISSVVCGCIVAVCVMYVLNRQKKEDTSEKLFSISIISIYMLLDFFFLGSNRFNEPTIFSMAIIAFAMVILVVTDKMPGKMSFFGSLSCGLLAGFSFTFVYIYNIYWAAALAVAFFINRYKEDRRSFIIHFLIFSLGILISTGSFLLFLNKAFDMSLSYYLAFMKGIGGRGTNRIPELSSIGQAVSLLIKNFPIALEQFATSNLFRYNPALLFLFLASIPVVIIKIVREQRLIDIFIVLFFIFRIGLSVLIPYDWYEKKLVQIFPCVMYAIGAAIMFAPSICNNLSKEKKRLMLSAYTLIVITLGLLTYQIMAKELFNNYRPVEYIAKYEFLLILMMFPFMFIRNVKLKRLIVIVMLFIIILPSIRLSHEFIYGNPSYKRRDAQVAMGRILNGKILAGGVSYAIRLYNTSVPVMNFYNYYYYGSDRYNELSIRLFKGNVVDGAVFYTPLPTDPQHFLASTVSFIEQGGLVLDSEYDLNEDANLKYGLFLVPVK